MKIKEVEKLPMEQWFKEEAYKFIEEESLRGKFEFIKVLFSITGRYVIIIYYLNSIKHRHRITEESLIRA